MFRILKLTGVTIFAFFMLICAVLLSVKILAYRNAVVSERYWNESKTYYFIAYRLNYKPYGGIGRVLKLFSNQSFFAVYNKSDKKLKSSAWYF